MSQHPCPKCSTDRQGLESECANCGWRPQELNQQMDMAAGGSIKESATESLVQSQRWKTLWWGYLIAPIVAPVLFAVFVFVFGMAALIANPDSTGTPIGVIVIPALSLTIGVFVSYFVAGSFGMPIIFALESRGKLNGYTIHVAALTTTLGCITVGGILILFAVAPRPPVIEVAGAAGGLFLFTSPFVLASATTYWWITSRGYRRISLRAMLAIITVAAILLAALAPIIRTLF